jgi:hypothetical protein
MTSTRADEIADELQGAVAQINRELSVIPREQWSSVTAAEGWTVGHCAHNIAEGYGQSLRWIDAAVERGQPIVLDDEVTRVNEANARCLELHGDEPQAETMALLENNARRLVERVRVLTDEQLDSPMMIFRGEPRLGSTVALNGALRHANTHLESIRATTTALASST